MNWKNHAHLFANGKFSVETVVAEQQIQGISVGFHGNAEHYQQYGKVMYMLDDGDIRPLNQCQLIARPISDMTDEEVKDYPNYGIVKKVDWWKGQIEHRIRNKSLSAKELLYLLSIGVYPFDYDEDVIFKNRNER